MAVRKNLQMVRGDTFSFNCEFSRTDIVLDSAYFTCRDIVTDAIIFQKSLGSGISKVSGDENIYAVRVAPEDTQSAVPDTYKYDFEVGFNSDVETMLIGNLLIVEDQTR